MSANIVGKRNILIVALVPRPQLHVLDPEARPRAVQQRPTERNRHWPLQRSTKSHRLISLHVMTAPESALAVATIDKIASTHPAVCVMIAPPPPPPAPPPLLQSTPLLSRRFSKHILQTHGSSTLLAQTQLLTRLAASTSTTTPSLHTALCSLPKLTCPSDDIGPSP